MRVSPTFSVYFARHYIFWLCSVFLVLLGIVALFDFVELLRRASGKEDTDLTIVLQMSAFKLPQLVQEMLPFSVLFGAMFSFLETRTKSRNWLSPEPLAFQHGSSSCLHCAYRFLLACYRSDCLTQSHP